MFRSNSRMTRLIGKGGVDFVTFAAAAIQRILPHVEVSQWEEAAWSSTESVWVNAERRQIRVTISIGLKGTKGAASLRSTVMRKKVIVAKQAAGQTLDTREYDICKIVAAQIESTLKIGLANLSGSVLRAIRQSFDEEVIAEHVRRHNHIEMSISDLFGALHSLSEQTYENKSLSFGCLIDSSINDTKLKAKFPVDYLIAKKKYKALSDGFRTAYYVSGNGHVLDFFDLDSRRSPELTAHNYYPDWGALLAKASRGSICGIALSRQGDILVFDGGTLRFTHRHGRWQYWNHNHIVNLLCDRGKAQSVPPRIMNQVIASAYVAALDISFRRTGGLIVNPS